MRRTSNPNRQRQAVTRRMLLWIVGHLDFAQAHHRVIGGAAMLGFFFLLRSAEYLGLKGQRTVYTLQVRDVVILDKHGLPTQSTAAASVVQITFRGHKTDQEGHGTTRFLERSGHQLLCPVKAALLLRHNASVIGLRPTDPLCSLSKSSMVTATVISRILRLAATATGKDPAHFSCHSLRCGGATALLSAGVDSTIVMLHGRWRSDVFQRYTRYSEDTGSTLGARMIMEHRP